MIKVNVFVPSGQNRNFHGNVPVENAVRKGNFHMNFTANLNTKICFDDAYKKYCVKKVFLIDNDGSL